VAAVALPAMMKVTDGEANERRRRWLTVAATAGSRTNEEEEE